MERKSATSVLLRVCFDRSRYRKTPFSAHWHRGCTDEIRTSQTDHF